MPDTFNLYLPPSSKSFSISKPKDLIAPMVAKISSDMAIFSIFVSWSQDKVARLAHIIILWAMLFEGGIFILPQSFLGLILISKLPPPI